MSCSALTARSTFFTRLYVKSEKGFLKQAKLCLSLFPSYHLHINQILQKTSREEGPKRHLSGWEASWCRLVVTLTLLFALSLSLSDTPSMFLSIFARFLYILVSSSFFFQSIVATNWGLSDTITQIDFYQQFTWYTDTDPTKGNVNYQSLESAMSTGITTIQNDQFIMAVDTNQTAYDGRNSVRITSQKSYSDGIYVWVTEWQSRSSCWQKCWWCLVPLVLTPPSQPQRFPRPLWMLRMACMVDCDWQYIVLASGRRDWYYRECKWSACWSSSSSSHRFQLHHSIEEQGFEWYDSIQQLLCSYSWQCRVSNWNEWRQTSSLGISSQ